MVVGTWSSSRLSCAESLLLRLMSSYNAINGTYASESHELLTEILRDEWGFEGMVMTDWGAGSDAIAQMNAGNDMLQPGNSRQVKALIEGIENGSLDEKVLDRNVRRVLEMILKTPGFKGYENSDRPDLEAHAKVTRQSATEGMVLLKNEHKPRLVRCYSCSLLYSHSHWLGCR